MDSANKLQVQTKSNWLEVNNVSYSRKKIFSEMLASCFFLYRHRWLILPNGSVVYRGNWMRAHYKCHWQSRHFAKWYHKPGWYQRLSAFLLSGTTWSHEIIPLILSGGDPASVETLPSWDRAPWVEDQRAAVLGLHGQPSPRLMTTHMHCHLMPPSFFKVRPRVNLLHNSWHTVSEFEKIHL